VKVVVQWSAHVPSNPTI